MFRIEDFCNDNNIPYSSKVANGWINIRCQFCNDTGLHLGINIEGGYTSCFKCGYHPLNKVISILTRANFSVVKDILQKYSTGESIVNRQQTRKNIPSEVTFPPDTKELTNKAKKYLISRKFDPDKLVSIWKLLSTSHIGFYKFRILAPIYYKKRLVSYQCRDITGIHPQKYLACFQDEEIIEHQHILYGFDQATQRGKKTCLVVEGITDVWRMGVNSICVFGISFTKQQAELIAKNFNKVFILFDSEDQAQEQAEELGFLISSAFTNPVEVINFSFIKQGSDPGDLSQDDADALMRELGF